MLLSGNEGGLYGDEGRTRQSGDEARRRETSSDLDRNTANNNTNSNSNKPASSGAGAGADRDSTGPVFNPAGAVRAEKFADSQQKVSARETIALIAGDNPIITYTESGKTLYKNPVTGKQVVYDNAGKYFRVKDTNVTGPLRYLDQFGKPIPNNVPLVKKSGTSETGVPADVRKALTHFTDGD